MDLGPLFISVSMMYGLPSGLLEAVCYVESGHKPDAYRAEDGGSPSIGICQAKSATCRSLGIERIHDIRNNVRCAGVYLSKQIKRYGNVRRGVCAYNRGKSTGDGDNRYTRRVYREWRKQVRR